MNVVRCSLSVLLWATLSASLFQEDVGVIDWTHSLIGTPVLSVSFGESLIVASSHSVLSRISGDSGEIQWRQAHESPIASLSVSLPPHASSASSHSPDALVIASTNDSLRAYNAQSGFLRYSIEPLEHIADFVLNKEELVFATDSSLNVYDLETGKEQSKVNLANPPKFIHSKDGVTTVYHVDGSVTSYTSKQTSPKSLSPLSGVPVLKNANVIICVKDNSIYAFLSGDSPSASIRLTTTDLKSVKLIHGGFQFSKTSAVFAKDGTPIVYSSTDESSPLAIVGTQVYSAGAEKFQLLISSLVSKDTTSHILQLDFHGRIKSIHPSKDTIGLTTSSGSFHIFSKSRGLYYSSLDSLATITASFFLELPEIHGYFLAKNEIGESETEHLTAPFLETWMKRWSTHLARIPSLVKAFLGPLADPMAFVTASSSLTDSPHLVRDRFGFKKLIISSTASGSIVALDTLSGSVVWQKYFGGALKIHLVRESRDLFPPLVAVVSTNRRRVSITYISGLDGTEWTDYPPLFSLDPVSLKGDLPIQVYELPIQDTKTKIRALGIVSGSDFYLRPDTPSTRSQVEAQNVRLFQPLISQNYVSGSIVTVAPSNEYNVATTFNLTLGPSEQLKSVATQSCSVIANIGRVLHDRSVLYKYLNPHLVAIATTKLEPHPSVSVILLDSVTGNIYFRGVYPGGHGTPKLVLCENSVVVGFKTNPLVEDLDLLVDKPIVPSTNEDKKPTLKNKKSKKSKPKNYKTRVETGSTKGYEVVVLDVFESLTSDERMPMGENFTSFESHRPQVVAQSFVYPFEVVSMGVTNTRSGITAKEFLFGLARNQIVGLQKQVLEPRRPMTAPSEHEREEGIPQYVPIIPFAPMTVPSHKNLLLAPSRIITSPTGLESTSLLLVTGLDLYLTRRTPSKTFDLLSEEFSKGMLVTTILAVVVGVFVSKSLGQRKKLTDAWM